MKIKYCGPSSDYSGYGEANRHDIAALVEAGVQVTTEIPRYTVELSDFGPLGAIAKERENAPLGYRVKILHTTPNVFSLYMEPGKYHIGRVFWETNKLPLEFATGAQKMDEIWTGSQYNAQAIKAAGVTRPIHIIPEAIDTNPPETKPYLVQNKDDFKFYSIFEWTERKNPGLLLEAFWQEFTDTPGVSLTIKTYIDNFQPEKRQILNSYIKRIKKRLNFKTYAPVYLFRGLMDRRQVYRLHATFDCYVSPHRGEGWGIPQMEAMLMGKPVISTNCGGIHEYLVHQKTAYLLPYKLAPVKNSRNDRWYTVDQQWAEVNITDLRKGMRWVYENRNLALAMGEAGQKLVKEKFALKVVGGQMLTRLNEIQKEYEAAL
jgi:glycosyltransferase involved in cell wall biosynthesis